MEKTLKLAIPIRIMPVTRTLENLKTIADLYRRFARAALPAERILFWGDGPPLINDTINPAYFYETELRLVLGLNIDSMRVNLDERNRIVKTLASLSDSDHVSPYRDYQIKMRGLRVQYVPVQNEKSGEDWGEVRINIGCDLNSQNLEAAAEIIDFLALGCPKYAVAGKMLAHTLFGPFFTAMPAEVVPRLENIVAEFNKSSAAIV